MREVLPTGYELIDIKLFIVRFAGNSTNKPDRLW
jgi:hypothetical protein